MTAAATRLRRCALAVCVMVLTGCAAKAPPPLYAWGSFPRQQYDALRRDGYEAGQQIQQLEAQAQEARGANAALPPGLRAHLGMLQLDAGNVDRARELWTAEKAAFPESAAYMDRLLRKLDARAAPAPAVAVKENPA